MLSIYFGDLPEELQSSYIYNTSVYFDNTYKNRWIVSPFAKRVISSVDKSEVVDENTILSPIFGNMSPKKLSGGTKSLLLMNFDKSKIFNASTCGDNCAEYILEIASDSKLVINLHHLMDFGKGDFKIRIVNTDEIVHNMAELVDKAGMFV